MQFNKYKITLPQSQLHGSFLSQLYLLFLACGSYIKYVKLLMSMLVVGLGKEEIFFVIGLNFI